MSERSVAERPARLDVGVIGAGRVGAVLGAALQAAGHRVIAAAAVSEASLARAADLLPGATIASPLEVAAAADLLLLTVPDDALPSLIDGFVSTQALHAGQLVMHTSGRYGANVLAPLTSAGTLPLAVHPVMTFTGRREDVARLAGCSFGVTAPEPLRPIAEALVLEMGGEPQWIDEANRPLYHAALAIGANHLSSLVAQSLDLLRRSGVADPARMIGPLLIAALDNTLRMGDAALTGPVARGDAGTVAAHVRELTRVSPAAVSAYVAMARLTADRALSSGLLAPGAAEALLDVLAQESHR